MKRALCFIFSPCLLICVLIASELVDANNTTPASDDLTADDNIDDVLAPTQPEATIQPENPVTLPPNKISSIPADFEHDGTVSSDSIHGEDETGTDVVSQKDTMSEVGENPMIKHMFSTSNGAASYATTPSDSNVFSTLSLESPVHDITELFGNSENEEDYSSRAPSREASDSEEAITDLEDGHVRPESAPDVGPANFLDAPETFTVDEGSPLELPCHLRSDAGVSSLLWLHDDQLLVAGPFSAAPQSQPMPYRLLKDHTLQIDAVGLQDTGTFTCRVYTDTADGDGWVRSLKHSVLVLPVQSGLLQSQASLDVIASGTTVVQKGHAASLSCRVVDDPSAEVTWSKQEGRLPYGEGVVRGSRLDIGQVDRSHAGTYTCFVSSSGNRTASRSLQLRVNFAPEVKAVEQEVRTGEGYTAELRCHIFSQPPAQVTWRRASGLPLKSEHHVTSSAGTTFTLSIQKVAPDDLGTYFCSAKNNLGANEAPVLLTGRPGGVKVTSLPQGTSPNSYSLIWETESHTPLLAYKLLYRQRSAEGAEVSDGSSSWREVTVPLVTSHQLPGDVIFHQRYVISGLSPGGAYEVHVLANNRHGWSRQPARFTFHAAPAPAGVQAVHWSRSSHSVGRDSASSVRAGAASWLIAAASSALFLLSW